MYACMHAYMHICMRTYTHTYIESMFVFFDREEGGGGPEQYNTSWCGNNIMAEMLKSCIFHMESWEGLSGYHFAIFA